MPICEMTWYLIPLPSDTSTTTGQPPNNCDNEYEEIDYQALDFKAILPQYTASSSIDNSSQVVGGGTLNNILTRGRDNRSLVSQGRPRTQVERTETPVYEEVSPKRSPPPPLFVSKVQQATIKTSLLRQLEAESCLTAVTVVYALTMLPLMILR